MNADFESANPKKEESNNLFLPNEEEKKFIHLLATIFVGKILRTPKDEISEDSLPSDLNQ